MSIFHLEDQQELTWHVAVLKEGTDGFEGVNLTPPDASAGWALSTSFVHELVTALNAAVAEVEGEGGSS